MNSEQIQRYTTFVEHTLQDIARKHETGSMLVAGQVLAIVLTDITRGTENEQAAKQLVHVWDTAVANEEGPLMPVEFTKSAIREFVESEQMP